jgi:hypothetical protein
MNKKILVPLAQNDRAEEIIPYVENVARPGMKVVFLMRYPVDGFIWGKEEYGMRAALEAKQLINHYSWEENLCRAAKRISYAAEVLGSKGVEATVDVYAGGLKKALRAYTQNGDVHLIMMRAGIADWIARLFDGTGSLFDWFRSPRFYPVLLTQVRTLR